MSPNFEWDDSAVVLKPQEATCVLGDFEQTVILQRDGMEADVAIVVYGRPNLRMLTDALENRYSDMDEEP